ncbi:hypothetical protein [Pedobacter nyackensis]|uniref:hypothetical protein n=1 Tax=Pedobacter nyackensis TaxID=475255 RepID=UPI00293199A9|nr:hypothetical protein [Pedobacter nyackensis]
MIRKLLIVLLCLPFSIYAQQIILKNDKIARTLKFDGKGWRTQKFSNLQGNKTLIVNSDEFSILPLNSNKIYTINDFRVVAKPVLKTLKDTVSLSIVYEPLPVNKGKDAVPQKLTIKYYLLKGQSFSRKELTLEYASPATVDRLEVERFTTDQQAIGGGRGEPVFVNQLWYFGLEYPAGYSRHTDGNTPQDYSRHYEKVGNYSFIDLDGRDIEPQARKGLLRLMHFPGFAVQHGSKYKLVSKTAVAGTTVKQEDVELAFMDYLATIWKAPRSFLHFNNWFEPQAKDLKGDGLLNIWRAFKTAISPYGVKMDAMVADDGWQDRKSIWEPTPKYFPNGYKDVKALSDKLNDEGVGFGLWLSLNGYTNNIDWGVENGYKEAVRNDYFKRYGRNYSISATKYKEEVLKKIPQIAKETNTIYYKHDFNVLSDMGEGNNHPATDRHGHEATLDATLEVLTATRKMNPGIYQNMTNWIWFSPWWLKYSDYLWMLAGDDGTNGNWAEISTRTMGSTDRDTYIWRMYGNPADRPLIPISRLMTHGIIKTSTGMMESKEDNLQDWAEYVLMHYGRGTLLKEWYISPSVMKPDDWKVLCTVDGWAKKNRAMLTNTVFVGGRPDDGKAYGYVGWEGDKGVLIARNTAAVTQKLIVPFDHTVGYKGGSQEAYRANVVFPYQAAYPLAFVSGKDMVIEIPGYATLAFEFEKGKPSGAPVAALSDLKFTTDKADNNLPATTLMVPGDVKGRCDLLVIGYPESPAIKINGELLKPSRSNKSKLNAFASYAKSGMINDKAQAWTMHAFNLLPYAGKEIKIEYDKNSGFEAHILAERTVSTQPAKNANDMLWAMTNDTRRQTVKMF